MDLMSGGTEWTQEQIAEVCAGLVDVREGATAPGVVSVPVYEARTDPEEMDPDEAEALSQPETLQEAA